MKRIRALNPKAIAVYATVTFFLFLGIGITCAYLVSRSRTSEPEELPPIESPVAIESLVITPDGQFIIGGDTKGTINFWDSNTGEFWGKLSGHERPITAIAISADGTILVSASEEGLIKLWDLPRKTGLDSFNSNNQVTTQPRKPITALAISADGRFLIGGGQGGDVIIWNLADRKLNFMNPLDGDQGIGIESLAVSKDAQIIVSGNFRGKIKIWKKSNNDKYKGITLNSGDIEEIHVVTISEDGKKIISSSCQNRIRIWNPQKSWEAFSSTPLDSIVCLVAMSPDGKKIAGMNRDGDVKVWNFTGETELREPRELKVNSRASEADSQGSLAARSIALSRDGRVIAVGFGKTIRAWKLSN